MAENTYTYPFDQTGSSSDNLIVNERHVISPPDFTDFYFIVPFVGPFYEEGLKVVHWSGGNARELVNGVDFVLSYPFIGASRATANPVYGAISLYGREINGLLEVTYQTLGGRWTIDQAKAAELLSNVKTNPRNTTWEQVMDKPETFPVIDHEWNLDDMVGASEVVEELESIEKAILQAREENAGGGVSHINDRSNPHNVTSEQVGLGNVENYPVASVNEAREGNRNDRYMSPRRTAEAIDQIVGNSLRAHTNDFDNPHQVSKSQVGLSDVDNFATATVDQAREGESNSLFLTPAGAKALLGDEIEDQLSGHVDDFDNPHQVTAVQVGLGNVPNWNSASDQQVIEGSNRSTFITPYQVNLMISEFALTQLSSHTGNTNNPHQVTKAQVGLSDVDNFATANETQAREATRADLFMSPRAVRQAVESLVGNVLSDHMADRNNPHDVNKNQVGLGNVDNYSMASEAEARTGNETERFMSPRRTAEAIESLIGDDFNAHLADTSNPHEVNKTQVGLGNVEDFAIATEAQARTGTEPSRYMTPRRTAEAIESLVGNDLIEHITDINNPHEVTAEQVGLGNVPNYARATTDEAVEGESNEAFMTPRLVKEAIDSIAGGDIGIHVNSTNNPHSVTKAQVGLGNVENYRPASNSEAILGQSNSRYMTPATTKAVIDDFVNSGFGAHVSDTNNPHDVNKAQVGLGSVDNFSTANIAEAREGTATNRFMTPNMTREAIEALALSQLDDHTSNTDNPHSVTKAQVGLGSVENYGIASTAEVDAGIATNKYITPFLLARKVNDEVSVLNDTLSREISDNKTEFDSLEANYINHANNTNNPHSVTKAQVGLGNVENYNVASETEALEGSSNAHYMTPSRVASYVSQELSPINDELLDLSTTLDGTNSTLDSHVSNTSNPHSVTKAQVGLGNVENYGIASEAEALQGNSNSAYMTPSRVAAYVNQRINTVNSDISSINSQLDDVNTNHDSHINDTSNPHNVTKAQVGLGNVENYSPASSNDVILGRTDRVMTPGNVSDILEYHVDPKLDQTNSEILSLSETLVMSFEEATWMISGFEVPRLTFLDIDNAVSLNTSTYTGTKWILGGNGGNAFELINGDLTGISTPFNADIIFMESNLNGTVIVATNTGGFYRSTNHGSNWSTMSLGYSQTTPPIDIRNDGSNWTILYSNYLFVSTNNGSSWSRYDISFSATAMSRIHNGKVTVVSSSNVVEYQISNGTTTSISTTLNSIRAVEVNTKNELLLATNELVINVTKDSESNISSSVNKLQVSNEEGVIFGISQTELYRSLTHGDSWYVQSIGMFTTQLDVSHGNGTWVVTTGMSDIVVSESLAV